jgi:hypothetical protein
VIKFVSDSREVGGCSPGPPVSSTNKTDHHDITERLLKVALNTIKPTNQPSCYSKIILSCTQYTNVLNIRYRCYILIFPPYSFFSPEKWVYTQFPPRKNEYILRFSPRKSKYVLTHTHFSPHTSFSPLLF